MTHLATLQYFPMAEAHVCLEADCGCVHNSNSWCPRCSSTQVWPLTKWMNERVTRYAEKETGK